MAFESPIYRAPSLPKISRRNISSSVIRGAEAASTATTPKLQRSRFSFLKKTELKENKESLKLESTKLDSLEETNRILVEIQKQLSIDFATRIAERKQTIRGIKKQTEKERITSKESAIEGISKFNQKVSSIFDKVTAPAKNIFQKLMDFFGIIVSGVLINTAFTWLSNEKNREKLSETLSFVGKYWKEIAGVLIGLQVVSTITKLITALQVVSAVLLSPLFLKAVGLIAASAALISIGKAFEPVTRERIKQASESQQGKGIFVKGTGGIGDPYSGLERQLYGDPTALPGDFDYGREIGRKNGGTIPKVSSYNFKANLIKQYPNIVQRFSLGGTVGGGGSQNVDSVPAKLAPGEEVTRASAANLFRPLLKDINDNAGRLWVSFSAGVAQMLENNTVFKEVIGKFNIQLNFFKEQLDEFVTDIRSKKINPQPPSNGSFDISQKTKELNVLDMISPVEEVIPSSAVKRFKPILKQINVKKTKKQSRAPIVIPMTAPPIVQGGDELIQPSGGTATEEPQIGSVNIMNPYMSITPGLYGIFV